MSIISEIQRSAQSVIGEIQTTRRSAIADNLFSLITAETVSPKTSAQIVELCYITAFRGGRSGLTDIFQRLNRRLSEEQKAAFLSILESDGRHGTHVVFRRDVAPLIDVAKGILLKQTK